LAYVPFLLSMALTEVVVAGKLRLAHPCRRATALVAELEVHQAVQSIQQLPEHHTSLNKMN
jgi:hypothetical protein